MSDLDNLTDTIAAVLESDREGTPADPVNIVDAIYTLSRAIKLLGNADASTPMGGMEALGKSMQESADTIAGGLESVATAITGLAVAVENSR